MVLTSKQEAFAVKYVECGNATEAQRFAYDCSRQKDTTVNRNAFHNSTNNKIVARIKELQYIAAEKLLVSDESVLKEYARIGFSDVRNLFDSDGSLKSVHNLDDNTARAISSIKVVTKAGGENQPVLNVHEIKFWPKIPALEMLAKRLGLADGADNDAQTFNVTYNIREKVD